MNVVKKDLGKSQIELIVEVGLEEFNPFIQKSAEAISKEVKIEGFRPGKVPLEILKQKVGEMTILEEAAKILINKQVYSVLEEHLKDEEVVGQPEVDISKLAPNNPLEYKIKVNLLPGLTLGEYKDLKIKEEKLEVKDEEIDKVLKDLVEMRATEKISGKEIKEGDKVIASVNMFLDKVPLEDGQAPEATVLIGKNYFVEGFDKRLIGLKKGDKKEFAVNYPSNHWQKNLAGKKVDFKVEIKEVYERSLPEINDDLAKNFKFNNLKQLKENLGKTIEDQKKKENDQKIEIKIIDKIIEGSKFDEISDDLIKNETEVMMREVEQNVVSQGGKFDDYLSSIGKNKEQFKLELMPNAVKRVKSALALKEIAKIEKIDVSSEELDKELELLKERYKDNPDAVKNMSGLAYRSYLSNFILNQKIIGKLKDWNISK
jgi:trigger factor